MENSNRSNFSESLSQEVFVLFGLMKKPPDKWTRLSHSRDIRGKEAVIQSSRSYT